MLFHSIHAHQTRAPWHPVYRFQVNFVRQQPKAASASPEVRQLANTVLMWCCPLQFVTTTPSGDGFVTDDEVITAYQLTDPKPFFSKLLQRPYRNRVVLGPHLLSLDSTEGPVLDTVAGLLHKMNKSWGWLASEGFCDGLDCMRLPVVAGELHSCSTGGGPWVDIQAPQLLW